jgi:hypothetical protein
MSPDSLRKDLGIIGPHTTDIIVVSDGVFPVPSHLTFDMNDTIEAVPLLGHLGRSRKNRHAPSFITSSRAFLLGIRGQRFLTFYDS